MRKRSSNLGLMASILAVVVMTTALFAQDTANQRPHVYKLYLVPPPGGGADTFGVGGPPVLRVLNDQGTLGSLGCTSVPDPFFGCVIHETQTRDGVSTELGALPPASINTAGAFSVSDNGRMTGGSTNGKIDPLTGFPEVAAISFEGDVVIDLGNFGGNGSQGYAVNNRGQVVGYAMNTVSDPYGSFLMGCSTFNCFPTAQQTRATLWDEGGLHDLGTLGGNDAVATLINNSGQIAGTSYTNTIPNPTTGWPSQDPFFYDHGRMVDIGNLGGTFAYANYMNESGQVVGLSTLAGDAASHPFSWEGGKLTDIGTFGGSHGEAKSVNEVGQVVGVANLAGDQAHHAFLWSKGVLIDLGTLGGTNSTAWAINSSGQVVGVSSIASGGAHAFLWEKGTVMIDLNDLVPPGSGLYLQEADYINDRGQISGNAILDNGHERAYLLTPCDENNDCTSDMFVADTLTGTLPAAAIKSAPTGDEQISGFAYLLRQLKQGHRLPGQTAKPAN